MQLLQLGLFGEQQSQPSTAPVIESPKRKRRMVIDAELSDIEAAKLLAALQRQARKFDAAARAVYETRSPALPQGPWHELTFLCIDTETSGLDRNNHRVIEIAWVLFDGPREIESCNYLCRIDEALPSDIVELTGITDQMLMREKPFADHVERLFSAFDRAAFVVAYNVGFDKQFIEAELRRLGKALPPLHWIDPCVFIREVDRFQKGKKLSDATARWGIDLKDAHRALADARATGLLLQKLAPHIKARTLQELLHVQGIWQQEQERNFRAYLATKKQSSS